MNDPKKPPELFAERPVTSDFARSGSMRTRSSAPSYIVRRCLTLFVIFALIGGGFYWKFSSSKPTAPEEIPVIKADGTYKQRPEHPGGIDIPHQDVQVYQSLDGKGVMPKDQVEHLLPPPETPQASAVAPKAAAPSTPQIESLAPPAAPVETTATPSTVMPAPVAAPASVVTTGVPAVASAPKATVSTAATKSTTVAPKAAPANLDQVIKNVTASVDKSPEDSATLSGGFAIQLASLPDQAAAQATMKKLQVQYAETLGATQLRVVKADLGAKGIYYRIQSQAVTESRAKNLCAAAKAKNAGCILVRP